jgi:hypothetical protein
MVMSATPSPPTSMVTRIASMAAGGSREGGGREQRRGRERKQMSEQGSGRARLIWSGERKRKLARNGQPLRLSPCEQRRFYRNES